MAKKRPQQREEVAAPRAKRDPATGRLLPGGGSLNPGGLPARVLELRRLALSRCTDAMERAFALMGADDERVALEAVRVVLARGLGREGKAVDLPDLEVAAAGPSTTADMLDAAREALGLLVQRLTARVKGGLGTAEEAEQLGNLVQVLTAVAKQEREAEKAGEEAQLTTDELVDRALAALPAERLRVALEAALVRESTPPTQEAARADAQRA